MPLGVTWRVLRQELGGEPWSSLSASPSEEALAGAVPSVAGVVKPVPVPHEL